PPRRRRLRRRRPRPARPRRRPRLTPLLSRRRRRRRRPPPRKRTPNKASAHRAPRRPVRIACASNGKPIFEDIAMTITAAQVKELRERTGAGMMECKKALTETNGDMEAAIEHMRKTGLAKADKKAGRIAAEGRIEIAEGAGKAAIV